MKRVLIIGAEYGTTEAERYLRAGTEVWGVCYEPDAEVECLSSYYEDLNIVTITRRQPSLSDFLSYLEDSGRLPYSLGSFDTVLCLSESPRGKAS